MNKLVLAVQIKTYPNTIMNWKKILFTSKYYVIKLFLTAAVPRLDRGLRMLLDYNASAWLGSRWPNEKHDSREQRGTADHDHDHDHFVVEWGRMTLGGKDGHVSRETYRQVEASLTSAFVSGLVTRALIQEPLGVGR